MLKDNPFRAGNGKYLTRQLFYEEWYQLPVVERVYDKPMFSLYADKEDVINFGKRYVELRDPTGYKVSQELLDGYNHWTVLLNCRWFMTAKEVWDKEMDAMIQSDAIASLQEIAKDGLPAQRLAAAKYLANKEYRKDKTSTKGRPSRDLVNRKAAEMAASDRDIQEDLKRIQGVR